MADLSYKKYDHRSFKKKYFGVICNSPVLRFVYRFSSKKIYISNETSLLRVYGLRTNKKEKIFFI